MSFTAKVTFALCCASSAGIIFYVHYRQEIDRKQLHIGVERDIERQKRRMENLQILEQQQLLTEQLRKAQQEKNLEAA